MQESLLVQQRSQKKESNLWKVISAVVITGLVVALIAVMVNDGTDNVPKPTHYLSKEFLNQIDVLMNTDVDPCDDFHEYVCGGWTFPNISDTDRINLAFDSIAVRTAHQQQELVKANFPFLTPLYDTCLDYKNDVLEQGDLALQPIMELIDLVQDVPTFYYALGVLHRAGAIPDGLFEIDVAPLNLKHELIMTPVLPGYDWLNRNDMYIKVFSLLHNDPVEAERIADEVYDLEYHITVAYLVGAHNATEDVMTIDEIKKNLFPVDAYLNGLAASTFGEAELDLSNIEEIYIDGSNIIASMVNETAHEKSVEGLKGYLQLHVILNHINILPEKYAEAYAKNETEAAYEGPAMPEEFPSWKKKMNEGPLPDQIDMKELERLFNVGNHTQREEMVCTNYVTGLLSDYMAHEWIIEDFPKGNKAAATELVDTIYKNMGYRLGNVSWLDEETRAASIKKWSYIARNVGYDSKWDTYPGMKIVGHIFQDTLAVKASNKGRQLSSVGSEVNRNEIPTDSGMTVMTVNAFYYPELNSINMLAGLMMKPVFDADYPMLLNLARYGWVIGHEITHGFDNNGRLYNGTGYNVNWWTNASAEAFADRAQCIIDQYDGFVDQGFHLNGTNTLGENIADEGGLNVAYQSYMQDFHASTPKLHPKMTNQQLFFVWAGQLWCTLAGKEATRQQIEQDVHSTGKFRIIGPMSNMPEFADAFECKASSYMGRSKTDKRCDVW